MRRAVMFIIILGLASVTAGIAYADLNDGLVAYYKFEGNADDSSGNNYHGTELGGVNYLPGKVGQDADFDGVDAYIDMGVQLGGYSALSVFAWVKGTSLHAGNNFIQAATWYVSDAIGSDGGFQLAITNGFIRSWLIEDKLTYSLIAGPSIQLDRWYLIGYTWDGSTHRLYLDGVEVGSNPYTGTIGTSSKNALVASKYRGAGFEGFFGGEIDELRIYNRALSTSEIQVLSTPPTVSSTSPTDNATDVAVDAAITTTFSEAMDASTITTGTFLVNDGLVDIAGTVSCNVNIVTFTPTTDIDYDTTYTATITTDTEDLAGNALQTDYVWSFTAQSNTDDGGGGGGGGG